MMEMVAEIKIDDDRNILVIRDLDDGCYRVYNHSVAWGSMLSSKHPLNGFRNDEDFLGHIQRKYDIIR